MVFFNFGKHAKKQGKNIDKLLELGKQSYDDGSFKHAIEHFSQAVEILNESYKNRHSDADRSTLCHILLFRGKSFFAMNDFQKAHDDFIHLYELLENITVHPDNLTDCKLLRQASEFGAAAAEQIGDAESQKKLLIQHFDISKKIFETTEMAEDYTELGDSYDYLINISESVDEKISHSEKMKEIFKNLHKQFPNNTYFSERLEYAIEALTDYIQAKIADTLKQEDYLSAASCYEQLTTILMENTLEKTEVSYEDLDKNAEYFHDAAMNYQKAGDHASAIRCLEHAIKLRSSIVTATDSDVAKARLSYSYVMAITSEPDIPNKTEYANSAYSMLEELETKQPDESDFKHLKELAEPFLN